MTPDLRVGSVSSHRSFRMEEGGRERIERWPREYMSTAAG